MGRILAEVKQVATSFLNCTGGRRTGDISLAKARFIKPTYI
ncbi:MAG: hypothetical protein ACLR9W_04470 [Enterobacter hormaechei]